MLENLIVARSRIRSYTVYYSWEKMDSRQKAFLAAFVIERLVKEVIALESLKNPERLFRHLFILKKTRWRAT